MTNNTGGNLLDLLVRYRVAAGFALVLCFLFLARPLPWSLAAGAVLVLCGGALRTWASGYIRKTRSLAVDGPYALVRNPLYLGSFVIIAGLMLAGRRPLLAAIVLGLYGLVYHRKMLAEERHLETLFPEEFRLFRERVPRIVPRFARPTAGEGFSWRLLMEHGEYQLWIGLLAALAFLAVRAADPPLPW